MLFQQSRTCAQYQRVNERRDSIPFTYSIMIAVRSRDHLSITSQVEWKTRNYFIHLLDHHMLFQRSTTCPQYHRLNEGRDPNPFTYSIIIAVPSRKNLQRYHRWNGGSESNLFIYAVVWLCVMEVIHSWNMTCFLSPIILIYVQV
jgi:hypothetical protein